MNLKRGDHICAVYSTPAELSETVAEFLADGLRRNHRCWYVASEDQTDAVRRRLDERGIETQRAVLRGALKFISGKDAYVIHGSFDPERSMNMFNDAVAEAGSAGFTGFRAAAEMSWALGREDTLRQLIVYEALLKSLFASCRAIGLCMYDRHRMPLDVIDGALATHPTIRAGDDYRENPFYDITRRALEPADDGAVRKRLEQLAVNS